MSRVPGACCTTRYILYFDPIFRDGPNGIRLLTGHPKFEGGVRISIMIIMKSTTGGSRIRRHTNSEHQD